MNESQNTPSSERLYVVSAGRQSLVVLGWLIAKAHGRLYSVNPQRVSSLEEAHGMLTRVHGHVPESARTITTTGPGVQPAAAGSDGEQRSRLTLDVQHGDTVVARLHVDANKLRELLA